MKTKKEIMTMILEKHNSLTHEEAVKIKEALKLQKEEFNRKLEALRNLIDSYVYGDNPPHFSINEDNVDEFKEEIDKIFGENQSHIINGNELKGNESTPSDKKRSRPILSTPLARQEDTQICECGQKKIRHRLIDGECKGECVINDCKKFKPKKEKSK